MKVRYEFVTGEFTEIEVDDSLGELLVDFDRQEYNNNHKETRRHCSLDAYNLDDALFPSDVDVLRFLGHLALDLKILRIQLYFCPQEVVQPRIASFTET